MAIRLRSAVFSALVLAGCSGGGGSDPAPVTVTPPPPPPPPVQTDPTFSTARATSQFLSQATFGPSSQDIQSLTGTSASQWLVAEFNKPATTNLNFVINYINDPANQENGELAFQAKFAPGHSFWINAIEADDQLRQRTAFALSQIFVVSNDDLLFEFPTVVAHFQDVLVTNAFGNFRDLLEDVTYSPAMGVYLTYWQNQAEDPETGRMPDENYAREVMQLFTIGLEELETNGTPRISGNGEPIPTYDNSDVTGLAKVFTGLSLDDDRFFAWIGNVEPEVLYSPMRAFPRFHSTSEKVFLDTSIPAGSSAEVSIDHALDTLFNHPNVGPFIGRQLIQRLTRSSPSPAYVGRVAEAFNTGSYTLPDDTIVGSGLRGDMRATIAAVLMDEEARVDPAQASNSSGKLREPILRFIHWARAFNVGTVTPQYSPPLWDSSPPDALAQHPFRSPSVFNFYRPGYTAPGTQSGAAGLTVPELQITNASSVVGYSNFMTYFIYGIAANENDPPKSTSFIPDYAPEIQLAGDVPALIDRLDLVLTAGTLSTATRNDITTVIESFPLENENDPNYDGPLLRVGTAILMIMTAPDYVVQQ